MVDFNDYEYIVSCLNDKNDKNDENDMMWSDVQIAKSDKS